jgi:hypothetical protein
MRLSQYVNNGLGGILHREIPQAEIDLQGVNATTMDGQAFHGSEAGDDDISQTPSEASLKTVTIVQFHVNNMDQNCSRKNAIHQKIFQVCRSCRYCPAQTLLKLVVHQVYRVVCL